MILLLCSEKIRIARTGELYESLSIAAEKLDFLKILFLFFFILSDLFLLDYVCRLFR